MFRELPFVAQKISIRENMRGLMVIFHRKSGYTIAEETTGGRLTLCACAQLHRFLGEAWPPTHCRQEDALHCTAMFKSNKKSAHFVW